MGHSPDHLCTDISWLLSRASHGLMTEMTAALEDLGLSPRARCVLTTAVRGEFTQIEIARMIGVDKTTMVVTLDELERDGLAERRPSSTDRRARVIAVTKKGDAMVRKSTEVVQRVQDEVLSTLPARERTALVDGLQRLVTERLAEPAECLKPVRRRRAA